MKIFGFDVRRAEQRDSVENPAVSLNSAQAWAAVFSSWGSGKGTGARVTVETALGVPAVLAAVSFLSRTMAALPLHVYRTGADGAQRVGGGLGALIHDAPNDEWTSFDWREYLFWQVFTLGRGLSWIERSGSAIVGIWPMDTRATVVKRQNRRRVYEYTEDGVKRIYPASDVIDVPFAFQPDMLSVYSPIDKCRNAIGLAIAMEQYAGEFFNGGGVPPLALTGPVPANKAAMDRAMSDIFRSIEAAKESDRPMFPMPPGHELKPVAFEPEKGQMSDARQMQIEEIARTFQIPPVFLQDLTHGTLTNTEQQDLFFVKHAVAQWAKRFEQQLNLKLFGQKKTNRYVEHNLDGLLRGDFVTRMNALAQGVQNAILEPNEARGLENRPARPFGDQLFIQGATLPLSAQQATSNDGGTLDPEA